MDPCVNCGTVEPVVPVPSCDCQCNPCPGGDQREIRLIAPTRDEYSDWVNNDPILPEGVLALVKDRLFEGSVEYIIGDGEHTYSELQEMDRTYAGAPLSRTGKANHSPLAAEGKSTLDPSWLPAATSDTLGAVMVSATGAAGKVPIPASGSSTLDSSWLPVSTSGTANKIPIADNNGKLDPSWLPEATSTTLGGVKASTTTAADCVVKADANGSLDGWKDAIVNTIENENGGLVVDPNTGNLAVDFSQMPTNKFEDLLKSLKMLIPLSANMNLYVNTNHADAGDSIIDNRGTENLPFKTIQAAVNFVTTTYSVGRYAVTIYIASGTYNEEVVLPTYTRTTGNITLTALDLDNPPTITNTHTVGSSNGITITGGLWYLKRLVVTTNFSDPNSGYSNVGCGIEVTGGATIAFIQSCSVSCTFNGTNPGLNYDVRVYSVNNGATCRFSPISGYSSAFNCNYGNAKTGVILMVYTNGTVDMLSTILDDNDIGRVNQVNGVASSFAVVNTGSKIIRTGGGLNFQTFSGTLTGKKYSITTSSYIIGPAASNLPGDTDGTADSDTFCYYKVG